MTTDAARGALIEVRSVFFIAGQGTVVVGHVLTGTARVGQLTAPLALGDDVERRLEVATVQRLSSMEARGQGVGIVFRDPPGLNELKLALPPGSMLELDAPDAPGAPGVPAGKLAGRSSRFSLTMYSMISFLSQM